MFLLKVGVREGFRDEEVEKRGVIVVYFPRLNFPGDAGPANGPYQPYRFRLSQGRLNGFSFGGFQFAFGMAESMTLHLSRLGYLLRRLYWVDGIGGRK